MAKGEIIAQWDDDDWYSPNRLSVQTKPLRENKADMSALYNHLFYEIEKGEYWTCTEQLYNRMFVRGVAGGTLVYRKSIYEKHALGYPDQSSREDSDFMVRAIQKGARLQKIDGQELFVYIRHGQNSWRFETGDFLEPENWSRVKEPCFIKEDRPFFALSKEGGKVSCIMVTADRREYVYKAIENFLNQDYQEKELIIVDDGDDKISDLIPPGTDMTYIPLDKKRSIGAKRNIANTHAKGDIIIHWDDDDWRSCDWITCQAACIKKNDAQITGLKHPIFYDPLQDRAWHYQYPSDERTWVHGGSLCYRKKNWERNPFPEIDIGEDWQFIQDTEACDITPHDQTTKYVAMIHDKNISPKHTTGKRWHPFSPSKIRKYIGEDFEDYKSTPPLSKIIEKANKLNHINGNINPLSISNKNRGL